MVLPVPQGYVFNRTRQCYLAADLHLAATHWSRFRGLMGRDAGDFGAGKALWIVPCHGVHTLAMRFPIDVLYLDRNQVVVHLEQTLKPWRVAAVRRAAASVLELPDGTLRYTGTVVGDVLDIATEEAIKAAAV
ncbi:MAG: DUF192 domain-containing protein [Candidatus Angelobacter sp.]